MAASTAFLAVKSLSALRKLASVNATFSRIEMGAVVWFTPIVNNCIRLFYQLFEAIRKKTRLNYQKRTLDT
jgi:hypothetical protein